MKSKSNLRAAAWLALLFAAGAAIGGTAMARRAPLGGWPGRSSTPVEEAWRQRRMENLKQNLGLTVEQEARITTIMDVSVAELRELRENLRTRTARIIGRNSAAIREQLTPEQIAKYDAWLKQYQLRRSEAQSANESEE